jgi:hypothetical protein
LSKHGFQVNHRLGGLVRFLRDAEPARNVDLLACPSTLCV